MGDVKHTATPWHAFGIAICADRNGEIGPILFILKTPLAPPLPEKETEAACVRIVQAVNAHDELVAALTGAEIDVKAAITYIEHHERAPAHGLRQTLDIIRAALSKAKGG